VMFAVVPTGEPTTTGPCSGAGFKRVEFQDLRVTSGQELIIPKMIEVGVTPWVIRVGRKEVMTR
jgi:hypothetical protein